MPAASRVTDTVAHPLPPILTGSGSPDVMIGFLPAWRGVPLGQSMMYKRFIALNTSRLPSGESDGQRMSRARTRSSVTA